MTGKATQQWMSEKIIGDKTILSRWLIPQNDLNIGTPYHGRPVGNSPEFMPLDNSLNYDVQSSHVHHCAVTAHLDENDVRKHSLKTPTRISRGIHRIFNHPNGVPSSDRIIHDVYLAFEAFRIVYEAGGAMVPQLCDRNGGRRDAGGNGRQHGGPREKCEIINEEMWLEPIAVEVFDERKALVKSRYLAALESSGRSDEESESSEEDTNSCSDMEV